MTAGPVGGMHLLELPREVLAHVVSRTPWSCRAVCRLFRDLREANCTALTVRSPSFSPGMGAGPRQDIRDISGLWTKLPSLTTLSVQYCTLNTGVAPLASCTNLVSIKFDSCLIPNVNALSSCTRLSNLHFRSCDKLTCISAIPRSLTDLTLNVCNRLQSIPALASFPHLCRLRVELCDHITDIDFLANCPHLLTLVLACFNEWTDEPLSLRPLASCPQLQDLELNICDVRDMSPMSGCQQLTRLSLQACDLSSTELVTRPFDALARLPNLRSLSLSSDPDDNEIGKGPPDDLAPLSQLTQITHLALTGCMCDDVSPLVSCSALVKLALHWCPMLNECDMLAGCALLEELDLGRSEMLYSVNALEQCARLRSLTIEECDSLESVDLPGHPALQRVAFRSCPSLQSVDLHGCAQLVSLLAHACSEELSLNVSGCSRLVHVDVSKHCAKMWGLVEGCARALLSKSPAL